MKRRETHGVCRSRRWLLMLCCALLAFLSACGDDSTNTTTDAASDAAFRDQTQQDTAASSSGGDATASSSSSGGGDATTSSSSGGGDTMNPPMDVMVASSCLELLQTEVTIDLDATDVAQFYPAAAFDGEHVWVTYGRRDPVETNTLDIHATQLGCDGVATIPPFQVNTTTTGNHVSPVVATSGNRVMFSWAGNDDPELTQFYILYRVFSEEGIEIIKEDSTLEPLRDGTPMTAHGWMPSLTWLPDGFALAAVWGPEDVGRFQVFMQRFDREGATIGDGVPARLDATTTQQHPSVTTLEDGSLRLAWHEEADGGASRVVHNRWPADTLTPLSVTDVFNVPTGTRSSYSAKGDRAYLATDLTTAFKIGMKRAEFVSTNAPSLQVGGDSAIDHTPAFAASETGGAVAWMRVVQGTRSSLQVARIDDMNGNLQLGTARSIRDSSGGPSAPALVHITGDVYFVSWLEGSNPEYRVKGRFIDLSP